MVDRSEASRAMAKAIAYKQCGKDSEAAKWARELIRILQCAEILMTGLDGLTAAALLIGAAMAIYCFFGSK